LKIIIVVIIIIITSLIVETVYARVYTGTVKSYCAFCPVFCLPSLEARTMTFLAFLAVSSRYEAAEWSVKNGQFDNARLAWNNWLYVQ
jgi:hypothetical protein